MGNVVQTNVASLNAQRNLYRTNTNLSTTFQRLASGFRINSAKDDAAGLVISNQLSAQIVSLNVGIRNANDGISVAQTAEGAMQEVTNLLLRARELAMSAASGQNSTEAREALDAEYQAIDAEITRIADDTEFGGQAILDGVITEFNIQVGKDAGQIITVTTSDITAIDLGDILTAAAAASTELALIDGFITDIDTARGDLGAQQNRLSSTISNLQNVVENVSASRSRIRDTDFAAETANLAKTQILQQAGLSVLAQANASSQGVLSLLQ